MMEDDAFGMFLIHLHVYLCTCRYVICIRIWSTGTYTRLL